MQLTEERWPVFSFLQSERVGDGARSVAEQETKNYDEDESILYSAHEFLSVDKLMSGHTLSF